MNREERRAAKRRSAGIDPVLRSAWRAFERENLSEAEALYERALGRTQGQPDALHMLGVIAHRRGDYAGAASFIGRAIVLAPDSAMFQHNLGEALAALGRLDEAAGRYKRALALEPNYASARNGLGATLVKRGQVGDASRQLQTALALEPELVGPHINLGILLEACGAPGKALSWYERAAALDPDHPELSLNRANALLKCGDAGEAQRGFRTAVEIRSSAPDFHSNLLLSLNYTQHDPEEIFKEHRRWSDNHAQPIQPLPSAAPDWDPDRCLRVGYVTPDLDRHSVGYFFRPLLGAHNAAAVETFCYTHPNLEGEGRRSTISPRSHRRSSRCGRASSRRSPTRVSS